MYVVIDTVWPTQLFNLITCSIPATRRFCVYSPWSSPSCCGSGFALLFRPCTVLKQTLGEREPYSSILYGNTQGSVPTFSNLALRLISWLPGRSAQR